MKAPSSKLQAPSSVIIVFLLLFTAGCQKRIEKEKAQEAVSVKVAKVELQELDEVIEYVGNVRAQDEAVVFPKVSGKIIEKLKEDGSPVTKSEAIAYIDRDEVGLKFEKAPIESPLEGIIGRVFVDKGQHVLISTPIALVVSIDKVRINLDIPENYLPKLDLGQAAKVTVDAYPDKEFSGLVAKISPVLDEATRSSPIEITVDNPGHLLKPGMFAKTRLVIEEHKNIPVILKEALIGTEPQIFVFVIEENKAVLKKVTLGLRQGPYYEVKEGLKQGDLVVIMGQQRLYEGAQVITEE